MRARQEFAVLHLDRHRVAAAMLSLLLSIVAASGTLAQPATPEPYPVAPHPDECEVGPARVEGILAILATPVAPPAASPTPFAIPTGWPADTETTIDVVATLHQLFACANAGDPSRVASLFTADFVRVFFGGAPLDDVATFLSTPPQPLPEEQKRVIVRIGEVHILPDGRAGVVIVLDEPDDPRTEEPDYAILELVGGRWLVDEIHEDGGAAVATPTT
jgi:hypothetical protein